MVGACTDVTRRKQSELEALAANAKFRAVFDQTTVFSGVLSVDGTVMDANRLCLDACGYKAEEVLGKPFWLAGWWRGSPEVREKIRLACLQGAQGTPYRAELPYHWADGTERLVEFELHPIRDEKERVIFLHPTGVDVTDVKRTQENYRTLADNISQFAWMANSSGWMYWFNQRWFDYTGTTLDAVQGSGWQSVLHPDHALSHLLRGRSGVGSRPDEGRSGRRPSASLQRDFHSQHESGRNDPNDPDGAGRRRFGRVLVLSRRHGSSQVAGVTKRLKCHDASLESTTISASR